MKGAFARAALIAALSGAACAHKSDVVTRDAAPAPQNVLVVTLEPDGPPGVVWPSSVGFGLSLGGGSGHFGGSIGGNIQVDREREYAQKLAGDLGGWNFASAFHERFLSVAPQPTGWTWRDGATAGASVIDNAADLYDSDKTTAGAVVAYAKEHALTRVLVVKPVFYGVDRRRGYAVDLHAMLFDATSIERKKLWEGEARSRKAPDAVKRYDFSGPNDRDAAKSALLDRGADSARALAASIKIRR